MNKLQEMIKIANIHKERIEISLSNLADIFPLNKDKIIKFTERELLLIELLTSRFAKLQDLIGKKIIDEFLVSKKEFFEDFTMIDKINKLEKLEIITDAQIWQDMRDVRNHVTHEYPDDPALTALYLNQLFELTPKLLEILNRIKNKS